MPRHAGHRPTIRVGSARFVRCSQYVETNQGYTLTYRKTGNLRAVQLLLGPTKMDSTVRYLGDELEETLAISEAVEIQRHGPSSRTAQSCR